MKEQKNNEKDKITKTTKTAKAAKTTKAGKTTKCPACEKSLKIEKNTNEFPVGEKTMPVSEKIKQFFSTHKNLFKK